MKILKYPRSGKYNKFKCTSKCKCGCKVRITDLSDIIHVKRNLEPILLFDPEIAFGWICPKCGNVAMLKMFHSWRICRILRKSGIEPIDYNDWCMSSNRLGRDSRANNSNENNFISLNLPMPELLYRKYTLGEDISDAIQTLRKKSLPGILW